MKSNKGYLMAEVVLWFIVFGILVGTATIMQTSNLGMLKNLRSQLFHSQSINTAYHSLSTDLKNHYESITISGDTLILGNIDPIMYTNENGTIVRTKGGIPIPVSNCAALFKWADETESSILVDIYSSDDLIDKIEIPVHFNKLGGGA